MLDYGDQCNINLLDGSLIDLLKEFYPMTLIYTLYIYNINIIIQEQDL